MTEFNPSLYDAALDALLSANVPREIAEVASEIVASDDASQPNNGRTAEAQEVINQVVKHLNEGWTGNVK